MTSLDSGPDARTAEPPAAHLDILYEDGWLTLTLAGRWTTQTVAPRDAELAGLQVNGAGRVRIETRDLSELDTTGAWLLHRTSRALSAQGAEVEIADLHEAYAGLLKSVASHDAPCPPPPRAENPFAALAIRVGQGSFWFMAEARDLLSFLGHTTVVFLRALVQPWRIRPTALISHMETSGLNALPIVGLISFLIGVVLAYQGADQLARFGAQIFTVNLVGIGVLREMGIILTAIIVAGRSGSAFTAQIGTMTVNEEVDAMRTIGLDPMDVLVLPRVLALVLVLPLLTFYADIMGLIGGAVMAVLVLDISVVRFIRQLHDAVPLWSFWVGIIKAPIFGFIIAMVGCYEGFKVSRSAESVGLRTTASVVEAIFLVIVLDAMFSILFSVLGI